MPGEEGAEKGVKKLRAEAVGLASGLEWITPFLFKPAMRCFCCEKGQ